MLNDITNVKIESIQILRAFACLIVFIYHLPQKYGSSGFALSIFFTISGYLLIKGMKKGKLYYFRKKWIRLLPLYWLLTIFLYCISKIVPGFLGSERLTVIELIKSLFFIPYFSEGKNIFPILSVGWTLIIEVFVYISFYFCYIVGEIISKNKDTKLVLSVLLFATVIFSGQIVKMLIGSFESAFIEVYSSKYLFSFLIGMLIYIFEKNNLAVFHSIKLRFSSILCIGLLIFSFFYFTFVNEIAPILFAGIIFFICINFMLDTKRYKVFTCIGDISFSFYLIHKFAIMGLDKLVFHNKQGLFYAFCSAILALLLSLFAAYISYLIFEVKITKFLKRLFCKDHIDSNSERMSGGLKMKC